MWNPNLNFEKETKDFFKYYYGPAADEMYKFMKSSENAVKRDDVRLPVFSYDNNYYSAKDWEEGLKHLKKALILADTDNYLKHGSFYAPHLENGYGGVLNEDLKEIKPDYYDHVRFEFMCYYAGLMTAKKEVYNELKNKNILPYKTKKDYLSEMTEYLSARGVKRADASNSFDNSMYQIREGKKEGTVPDICKNLQDDEWYDIQEKSMFLGIDLPQYRKTVEDPKASNGKAIWMNPKHIDWYVQTKLDYMFINEKFDKGDIYITYRIEPGEEQGEAFKAGLYDGESQFLFEYSIINDGNTEYKTEKIGSVDFANTKTGALVWLSGAGMENTAKCMYLDRIFVILK